MLKQSEVPSPKKSMIAGRIPMSIASRSGRWLKANVAELLLMRKLVLNALPVFPTHWYACTSTIPTARKKPSELK